MYIYTTILLTDIIHTTNTCTTARTWNYFIILFRKNTDETREGGKNLNNCFENSFEKHDVG